VTKKGPAAAVALPHGLSRRSSRSERRRAFSEAGRRAADFLALTKPRLNFLVVITAGVGYYLGSTTHLHVLKLISATVGIALVAGGAAGLNQVYERDTDGLMWRTQSRPLAARRLTSGEGTAFSLALAMAGLASLAITANLLAAFLALVTLISYNAVYTPMKRWSKLATLVGAVPGALPPMIGWAAARGTLTREAWALFAIVFIWQIPHFMAIAWLYRDDFRRAGFPLLPVIHPDGKSTARQAVIFSILLIPVSILPVAMRMAGMNYGLGALIGGLSLLALSLSFAGSRTNERAQRLFIGSITYLPLLWLLLVAGRR
jgi:protoheme IX farnesyltransferase